MKRLFFLLAVLGLFSSSACSAPDPADRAEIASPPRHDVSSEEAEPLDAVFLRMAPPRTDAASFMQQYAGRSDSSTDIRQPPVVCLSSEEELAAFAGAASACFTLTDAYGIYPAFSETVKQYDAAFFEKNRLAVLYLEAASGSTRYEVSGIHQTNGSAVILLKCNVPAAGTCDMAYWLACVPVSRALSGEDTAVCAQISSGPVLGLRRITDLRP